MSSAARWLDYLIAVMIAAIGVIYIAYGTTPGASIFGVWWVFAGGAVFGYALGQPRA